MPILSSDLIYRLSGGASNTSPVASLGGAMSTVAGGIITSGSLNNLFDSVSGEESAAGDVEYRCIYVVNNHATLTLSGAVLWIKTLTTSADTEFDIQLDPAAVGSDSSVVIASENDEPDTMSLPPGDWVRPTTKTAGLVIGDLAALQRKAFWIRRTVTAGASAVSADTGTIRVEGDSPA